MQKTSVVALLSCAPKKKVCAEDILESAEKWILSQEWQGGQRPRRRLGKTPADEYKPAYYEQGAKASADDRAVTTFRELADTTQLPHEAHAQSTSIVYILYLTITF